MFNKLFFVCPFSDLENFIRDNYGYDSYFITLPGAVFRTDDTDFMRDTSDFIRRKQIGDVYIVNDTSCPFINDILLRRRRVDHYAMRMIEEIYIDHYMEVTHGKSLKDQRIALATLNINQQINFFVDSQFPGGPEFWGVNIHGVVSSRIANQFHTCRTTPTSAKLLTNSR